MWFNNIYYILIIGLVTVCINTEVLGHHLPCNQTEFCEENIENSVCKNHVCQCKLDYFLEYIEDINKTICLPCPALGQQCGTVQCCRHSSYLTCSEGFCRCRNSYDGIYCWNTNSSETVQFESIAKMILGLALIFTIAVLGSLVWRLCSKQDIPQHSQVNLNRDTSFASLNSVQRLVLIRLQDRPPPYNPSFQPWKYYSDPGNVVTNQNIQIPPEAPPPYTITVTSQVPITLSQRRGTENPVFSIGEIIQGQQTTSGLSECSTQATLSNLNGNPDRNLTALGNNKESRITNPSISKSPDNKNCVNT